MKELIEDNYRSIIARGLITPSTSECDFLDKIMEEVKELETANFNLDKIETPKYSDNMREEMADVILTVLNFARHYDIDIETEMKLKIEKNYSRV